MGALTKIVGPSTPVGGVLMIAGYLSLVRIARIRSASLYRFGSGRAERRLIGVDFVDTQLF